MNFNNLDQPLKIKQNQSSKNKSENFKQDLMQKEASLKSIWDDWEKAFKTKIKKVDNWTDKSKKLPKNLDRCQFSSKKLLIMKEKLLWLLKKLKDSTES